MTLSVIEGGDGVPAEPDWSLELPGKSKAALGERAAATIYWQSIIDELRQTQKLASVNGHQVKRLVLAYVMFDRASRRVARMQPVIAAPKTKSPMHNPWWVAMNNADSMAAAIEAELTLTPRRRASGGKVEKKVTRRTNADNYLKPVAK